MSTWTVVGNGTAARIFCSEGQEDFCEIHTFTNPANRQHEQDLKSDRYGRSLSSSTGHSESYEEPSSRKQERDHFAGMVAEYLGQAHGRKDYSSLYLVCSPSFLGLLRKHLPQDVQDAVKGEIIKNLVAHSEADIRKHLPDLI